MKIIVIGSDGMSKEITQHELEKAGYDVDMVFIDEVKKLTDEGVNLADIVRNFPRPIELPREELKTMIREIEMIEPIKHIEQRQKYDGKFVNKSSRNQRREAQRKKR